MKFIKLDSKLWDNSLGIVTKLVEDSENLSAGIFNCKPGQRVPEEGFTVHEGTELSIVLSGEVVLGLEDGEKIVKEGEMVVIPRGILHYSKNVGLKNAKIVWVMAPSIDP